MHKSKSAFNQTHNLIESISNQSCNNYPEVHHEDFKLVLKHQYELGI
jgi:hypothetical protein